jgi:hypothetical protein
MINSKHSEPVPKSRIVAILQFSAAVVPSPKSGETSFDVLFLKA